MSIPNITAINKGKRLILLDTGEVVSIQAFADFDGCECEADEAVSFVAGPTSEGKWLSALVGSQEEVTMQ